MMAQARNSTRGKKELEAEVARLKASHIKMKDFFMQQTARLKGELASTKEFASKTRQLAKYDGRAPSTAGSHARSAISQRRMNSGGGGINNSQHNPYGHTFAHDGGSSSSEFSTAPSQPKENPYQAFLRQKRQQEQAATQTDFGRSRPLVGRRSNVPTAGSRPGTPSPVNPPFSSHQHQSRRSRSGVGSHPQHRVPQNFAPNQHSNHRPFSTPYNF
jgi:hypothetical protein